MKIHSSIIACLFLVLKAGAQTHPDSAAQRMINAEGFARHIQLLASDSFQGRKPFTLGETRTISYLKKQYQQLGLQAGNGKSYFQDVPMVALNAVPAGDLIINGKKNFHLKFLDDFVAFSPHVASQVSLKRSELVFAGYGIVAPEYHWNDYKGLNVKGKTVIVMVNDPGFADNSLFKGKTMTYYGRWTYKYEEAARQGAAGILIIHETAAASYPWSVVRGGFSGIKLSLQTKDNGSHEPLVEGWISTETAKQILTAAGLNEDIYEKARKAGFKAIDLGLNASVKFNISIKKSVSHNVLALLPGTRHKDQVIIYSAHWDHFGIGLPVNGDSIYHGAVDNGTGTAALIELAAAFKKAKRSERSILFLTVTGEEQGLLGSEYYASHPVYPLKKTVANLNIDALFPFGKMKDIVIPGAGQSFLEDDLKKVLVTQGRIISPDSEPSAGHFFRSDHFSFAKAGVPSLSIGTGTISLEHGQAWGKAQQDDYTEHRYHSPADVYDAATWDMSGIVWDTQALFTLGYELAISSAFPAWHSGSEFRAKRLQMMR